MLTAKWLKLYFLIHKHQIIKGLIAAKQAGFAGMHCDYCPLDKVRKCKMYNSHMMQLIVEISDELKTSNSSPFSCKDIFIKLTNYKNNNND